MSEQHEHPRTNRRTGKLDAAGQWFPVFFRAVAVLVVSLPAASKFVQYADWVGRFAGWGIPVPEAAVLVAAVVQVLAALSLALGIAGRLGASALAVVMVVAIVTAGPDPMNLAVLGSAVGVVLLGTGPYSLWDPTFADLLSGARELADEE